MNYNIYAGLSGSFGGATYIGTKYFKNEETALGRACSIAYEMYESYEGTNGILSWDEIAEQENLDPDKDVKLINEIYDDVMQSWIDYYVIPTDDDDIENLIEF